MKRILLVDDDALILEVYRKKLQQADFHVDIASDGLGAMKMLHSSKPDVVVLDMMMPKFSGLEVLKYIRSTEALKRVRVIVLSNMYVGGEQRETAAVEADRALAKSDCTPALLIEAINEVLAAPESTAGPATPAAPVADVERRLPP